MLHMVIQRSVKLAGGVGNADLSQQLTSLTPFWCIKIHCDEQNDGWIVISKQCNREPENCKWGATLRWKKGSP